MHPCYIILMDNQPVQPLNNNLPSPSQQPQMQSQQAPVSPKKSKLAAMLTSLLVIVLIAGVAGIYVWQHNQVNQDNIKLDNLQAQLRVTDAESKNSTTNAVAAGDYLTIPNYNIRFKLSSAISDAYYKLNSDGYIVLSVHKFDSNPDLANCAASSDANSTAQGVVTLVVAVPGEPSGDAAGDNWTSSMIEQKNYTKVGDAYFGFYPGNGACYSSTATSSETTEYTTVEKAFIAAEPTITSSISN
jgi:hypothetical protein